MKDEQKTRWLGTLIGVLLSLLFLVPFLPLIALLTIWQGWVVQRLWAWYIVPTFGWKPLTLLGATGLRILVAFLTFQPDTREGKEKPAGTLLAMACLGPLVALGAAWLVRWVLTR